MRTISLRPLDLTSGSTTIALMGVPVVAVSGLFVPVAGLRRASLPLR